MSKVINGHYSISEATAERVRAVMRALGYYPSASAQSFARGATPRGGPASRSSGRNTAFENPHLFEMIAGAGGGACAARGYSLELRGTDKTDASEAAAETHRPPRRRTRSRCTSP